MKRKLRLLVLLGGLFTSSFLYAQEQSISGTVLSIDDGSPIPGATVLLKGTTSGTVTDIDGNYKLAVGEGETTLIFSFIGYTSQEVEIGTRAVINISLETNIAELGEVIIVAYGETSKKKLTGSVGVVDSEMIKSQQVVSVSRSLQGTATGVNVITGSGQPGVNPTIRIRGINSINAGADPLIVVDGAVFQGNINSIDPNDVASISILKDAGSSVLYGSRASNGVIMITTKSGEVGDTKVDLSIGYGVSKRGIEGYDVLSTEDYAKLSWEAIKFNGEKIGSANPGQYASDNLITRLGYNPYGSSFPNPIDANGELVSGAKLLWDTDWESAIARENTMRKDVSLGVSGGSETMRYRFSTNYLAQEGYVITSKFDRISTRLNLDGQLNDWLSMGVKTAFSYSSQNYPRQSGSEFKAPVSFSRAMPGYYPLHQRDVNGDLVKGASGESFYDYGKRDVAGVNTSRPQYKGYNPAGTVAYDKFQRERYLTTLNGFLQAEFLENFSVRTSFAVDYYLYDGFDYTNFEFGDQAGIGAVDRWKDVTVNSSWWNQLAYQKDLGDHSVSAKIITEINNYKFESLNGGKQKFPFAGLEEFSGAATTTQLTGWTTPSRFFSMLFAADYAFKNRYFLNVGIRKDASSKFSKENRESVFSSVGAAWVLSDESFFSSVNFVNSLKLRGSYGQLGNDDLSDFFPYLQAFSAGWDDATNPGVYVSTLSDVNIGWEKTDMSNIGLDFSVLNSRISGSVEVFKKVTKDLIDDRNFPTSLGFGGVIETNVSKMENKGLEIALSTVNVKNDNFTWTTDFNISFIENKILELPPGVDDRVVGTKKHIVGKDIYQFYIRKWAGVDPSDGAAMWYADIEDVDGNVTGTTVTKDPGNASKYFVGSALPKFTGGFFTKASFKGLSLSALLNYSHGGKILDYDYSNIMHGWNEPGLQMHADLLNRWQQPGDITSVPRLNEAGQGDFTSTRFLFDNNYLRLRNITLGYELPQNLLDKLKIFRTMSVNLQADNLLTFSNAKKGLDPEQALNGLTNRRSSMFKTYSVRINIGF